MMMTEVFKMLRTYVTNELLHLEITTIGHSACWVNGPMALIGLGSNPGLEAGFCGSITLAGML